VEAVKEEDNTYNNPEEVEAIRLKLKNAFEAPAPAAAESSSPKKVEKSEVSKLDDSCYFENYSEVVIHRTMLNVSITLFIYPYIVNKPMNKYLELVSLGSRQNGDLQACHCEQCL